MGHALAVSDWIVNNMQLGRGREGAEREGKGAFPEGGGRERDIPFGGPFGEEPADGNVPKGTAEKELSLPDVFSLPAIPRFSEASRPGRPSFSAVPRNRPPSFAKAPRRPTEASLPELLIRTRCGAMRANQRPRSGLRSEGGRTLGKRRRRPDGTKRGSSPLARGTRFSLSQRGGTCKKGWRERNVPKETAGEKRSRYFGSRSGCSRLASA